MTDPTQVDVTIETVTGPIGVDGFTSALAHEHLFVDFLGPDHPEYCRVDWHEVRTVCLERLTQVQRAGVDLLVDCTGIGIGRNVDLLRDVSASSGIRIVCATGIYKSLRPPGLEEATIEELADLFLRELTIGVEGTDVQAGFIKLATTDAGPTVEETLIHRASAMAAVTTGSAIVLHSLRAEAAGVALETLEREGFDPTRLIWAHAQESRLAENLALASRGVTISLDAIGTSDDGEMLDRIEHLVAMGAGDRVVVSSDSSLVVHPVELAYERDISYLHRTFCPKVEARFGRELREALTRDNVFQVFGRGRDVGIVDER